MSHKTNTSRKRKPARKTVPQHGEEASKSGVARIAALSLGAMALAGGAALLGIFARRRETLVTADNAEHAAPDLAPSAPLPGTDRAPDAFRPDPTAPVPDSEREGLRPATGPGPTLVAGQADELRRVDATPS